MFKQIKRAFDLYKNGLAAGTTLFLSMTGIGASAASVAHQGMPANEKNLQASGLNVTPRKSIVVLALHGFGLNRKAFDSLGDTLEHQGIELKAVDIRGFGSKSCYKLNFSEARRDVTNELEEIQQERPGSQIFLLGESMGGALALTVAAKAPRLVAGVISSEPAYKVSVNPVIYPLIGASLLVRPNAEMKIPLSFAKRVFQDKVQVANLQSELREQRGYSALEMLRFQHLMHEVPVAVKRLRSVPVLFLQGGADRLVKPGGTIALSQHPRNPDHKLLLIPNRGHLLLENGQADSAIVSRVDQWMKDVVAQTSTVATLSN